MEKGVYPSTRQAALEICAPQLITLVMSEVSAVELLCKATKYWKKNKLRNYPEHLRTFCKIEIGGGVRFSSCCTET